MQLSIRKWRAKNIDNKIYENVLDSNGNLMDYKEFKIEAATEEALREKFLNAKIWDDKSFWEVKKNWPGSIKNAFLPHLLQGLYSTDSWKASQKPISCAAFITSASHLPF